MLSGELLCLLTVRRPSRQDEKTGVFFEGGGEWLSTAISRGVTKVGCSGGVLVHSALLLVLTLSADGGLDDQAVLSFLFSVCLFIRCL